MVSAAARRSILVGGGAPPAQKIGVGGGAGGQKIFFKDSRKISLYPQNFLITFLVNRKLQENNYAATISSAARRQIIGGGAPINKSRRGGAHKLSAARPAPGSSTHPFTCPKHIHVS